MRMRTSLATYLPRAMTTAALVAIGLGGAAMVFGGHHPQPASIDGGAALDPMTTAAVPLSMSEVRPEPDPVQLVRGLAALDEGDLATAMDIRDGMPEGALDRRILAWSIATSGADLSRTELEAARDVFANWPGDTVLARSIERTIASEDMAPDAVVEAFSAVPPVTPEGVLLVARAHIALGQAERALELLVPWWETQRLDPATEARVLSEFGVSIPPAAHRRRMERMLYAERTAAAMRVATLADAEALATAWIAVNAGDKNAESLLEAVPEAQRGAGWIFAKSRYLRRAGSYVAAAEIMLTAPTDPAALLDPDAWWVERRVLSREMLDVDDPDTAYRIAAAHQGGTPATIADAAFHAGWYALRHLGDAQLASSHFSRIVEIAEGPISLSRAHYWLGRAAEQGGTGDAESHYQRAAARGATFYGQLAAQKLGRTAIPVGRPDPSAADRRAFEANEAVRVIRRLEAAGQPSRAAAFYRMLAQSLTSPGEIALLTEMAASGAGPTLSLRLAKIAAQRGTPVGSLAHPTGAIPASADLSDSGRALAYAIARQESEFNPAAVSGAGARGLLQLLPGTARDVAKKAGLAYSAERLTQDAGYNATLGAAFLSEQLARFDGSYVLTFAGYNAGPRRAQDWMSRYGDPRGRSVDDVVDWVERIPFTETRHYVQRVMENYQVYKSLLTGRFEIADDLVRGR